MSEYLTPEEVEGTAKWYAAETGIPPHTLAVDFAATLREYAAIVEAVATSDPIFNQSCRFCGAYQLVTNDPAKVLSGVWLHFPDCLYLRARRVRGYE